MTCFVSDFRSFPKRTVQTFSRSTLSVNQQRPTSGRGNFHHNLPLIVLDDVFCFGLQIFPEAHSPDIQQINPFCESTKTHLRPWKFPPQPSLIVLDDVFCFGLQIFPEAHSGQSTCPYFQALLEPHTAFWITENLGQLIPRVVLGKARFIGP